MRFLFVTPVGEVGGAERSLLAWMAAVREAWPDAAMHLLVLGEGPLAGMARDAGICVQVLPLPREIAEIGDSGLRGGGRLWSYAGLGGRLIGALSVGVQFLRRFKRTLRDLRPDLIHSNGIKTHLLLGLARPKGVPVTWHLHDFLDRRPVVRQAARWASAGVAGAVAVSRAVATAAEGVLPRTPIQVVYNTVDTDHFSPGAGSGDELDRLAGLPPAGAGAVRVALVATYARWKGQDVFLEAASRVAREALGRAVRFYVVGGPIYRTPGSQYSEAELREKVRALGLADRVGFIPFQPDPAWAYRAADVVVHASTQPEPFGLTIVEAMACGRAVVVSRGGGAVELFEEGNDGVGVPPGDPGALAEAVIQLAHDPEVRTRLGRNARESVVRRFGQGTLRPQVVAFYEALLRRNGGQRPSTRGNDAR